MSTWLTVLLQVAFFAIIMFVVYKQLKERLLYKYNPNKWVVLIAAGVVFFLPMIITQLFKFNTNGSFWQYLDSAVFICLFLWFVDISNGNMQRMLNKRAEEASGAEKKKLKVAATSNKKNKNRDSRRRK
jgi:Na+/melibiose symporter-like transporter